MEIKALKKYFLSKSFTMFVIGIGLSVVSLLGLILIVSGKIRIIRINIGTLLLFIAGPVIVFFTLRNVIRTHALLSKLKRSNAVGDVYRSLTDTVKHVTFNENTILLSDRYLFLKEEVAIIPLQQITRVYTQCVKNEKQENTAVKVYCDTTYQREVKVCDNIKTADQLIRFVETLKQRNPGIIVSP